MGASPGTEWSFWPQPDPEIPLDSYSPDFLFRINLPVIAILLGMFFLPGVREWTGCDPWIIAAGFSVHFLYGVCVWRFDWRTKSPGNTEFFSNLANLVAVVAVPLSSPHPLFPLWILYLVVVWIDAYGNPKTVASLAVLLLAPGVDVLWHAVASGSFPADRALQAGMASSFALVIYMVTAYFTAWSTQGRRAMAENARLRATLEERSRISRNLHGSLGAALSEITLWQDVALAGAAGASDPLVRAQARAKSALTELRSLVSELDAETVTVQSLVEGIRKQAEGHCHSAGIRLEYSGPDGSDPDASDPDMAHAYHVMKFAVEAVANAVRHARPETVRLRLSFDPLEIEVSDDGIGFDPDAVAPGRGLRSLREHAEALGGRVRIVAAPGDGSRIFLRREVP